MPRASSSSAGPVLRRNQACRTCRRKKLKCDASRPHCGACVKAWKGMISVPAPDGYAHPEEPQCSYDPIEGLTLSEPTNSAEKIRQLEEQVVALKRKLEDKGSPDSSSGHSNGTHHSAASNRLSSLAPATYSLSPPSGSSNGSRSEISLPRGGLDVVKNMAGSASPASLPRSSTSSPEMNQTDDYFQLLFSGWNSDLPPPVEMRHLIDIFFTCDPCGSRILHRPAFLASLDYSPRDPRFPHSALLHAICASASRWSSREVVLVNGNRRDVFADYHAQKTRQYIDRTMASGADIFHVLQACIILSWYLYSEGRWVEVWIFAGFQTRVSVPLRLNHSRTFTSHGSGSPGAYLAPPKDLTDLEMRRRTWWMSILFDRIVSVGGWLHGIEHRRIATELPLRRIDFESNTMLDDNPQTLMSPDLYTNHPPQYTDSFLLLIKAVMLFGNVTDINTDYQLQYPQSPRRTDDPNERPGFRALEKLVAEDFLASLPHAYRNYLHVLGQNPNVVLDNDLYLVHLIPHAASITLHNPYINFEDPQSLSSMRCTAAAEAIFQAHLTFCRLQNSNTLMTRLHPFVVICWYLAAVVKVQVCKRMIEIGDSERETQVWGEINILRWAMCEYGMTSPIGMRQEKLLKTLMEEIVRTTRQDKPLEVTLPLYLFSHRSAFEGANGSAVPIEGIGAPLPDTRSTTDAAEVSVSQASSPSLALNGNNGHGHGHGMNGSIVGGLDAHGIDPHSLHPHGLDPHGIDISLINQDLSSDGVWGPPPPGLANSGSYLL